MSIQCVAHCKQLVNKINCRLTISTKYFNILYSNVTDNVNRINARRVDFYCT